MIKMESKKQVKNIVWAVFPVIFVLLFMIKIGRVSSSSMEPLLEEGDRVIINRLSYVASDPRKGDVVAFKKDGQLFIKRILGTSGDKLESKDGSLLLNGLLLEEPYIDKNMETDVRGTLKVPKGHYLVLGDYREASIDSRYWEEPFITDKDIIGRVVYVFDEGLGNDLSRFEIAEKK